MSYYLKGNKMYKSHIQDQWQQIQKSLKDGEIAIDFCNVKQYEHVFAFIIDNKCKYPRLEYCGHRHRVGGDFFGFYHLLQREGIKEIRHIFYSTTEEMAFIDMGENERAHKLHSISELLMPKIKSEASPTIYSFADINYWLGDSTIYDNENDVKGAITTEKLKGAKRELDFLRTSIPSYQLHFFSHDIATKEAFISITNQTFDILHVSSHGFFDKENSRKASNDDLRSSIEGITILDNCGIKLSGYNDDTESGCISATEISKLNLSNVGLVVLSACETGTGDSREGNIYSLAEAFHTAGVRNIIATTTQVEDNDAYTFFKTFMTEVTNGNSYHDSFVIAQKKSKKPGNYVFWE